MQKKTPLVKSNTSSSINIVEKECLNDYDCAKGECVREIIACTQSIPRSCKAKLKCKIKKK